MNNPQSTILVLDDESDLLELMSVLLTGAGYQVHSVQTADDMESYLKEGNLPNLLILDLLLAGEHGGELVRQLKDEASTREIPILMVSAHPSAEQEANKRSVDAFLSKPFDIDDFLALVASLLARKQTELIGLRDHESTEPDLLTSPE